MNPYIEALLREVKEKPHQFFIGSCVFFVAVMGTSVQHVASIGFTLLLVYSFFTIKSWRSTWSELTKNEKFLLGGFGLYAMSGVVAFINVQDTYEYIKDLERYLRFALAVPIYLLIKFYKIDVIKYLYIGAVVSGPFLFSIAYFAYLENPDVPSKGYYHHIIFGSLAMLNVGVMLSMLLTIKMNKLFQVTILVSMGLGFIAAVLSQSRGVWLVLPLYVLLALYYSFMRSLKQFVAMIVVLVVLLSSVLQSPISDMVSDRIDVAFEEVSSFYTDGKYISSLGTRLAMWEIAIDVWLQHPIIGTGPGDFDEIILALQDDGKYIGMNVHSSTHNIYIQSLVNAGLFGFVAMVLALFIMPFKLFCKKCERGQLLGLIVISSFAVFGLSESWTLRLPTVSVFLVYVIFIASCRRSKPL